LVRYYNSFNKVITTMDTIKTAANAAVEAVVGATTTSQPAREPEDWLKAGEVEKVQPDEDAKMCARPPSVKGTAD
jgi:hypothetical protein